MCNENRFNKNYYLIHLDNRIPPKYLYQESVFFYKRNYKINFFLAYIEMTVMSIDHPANFTIACNRITHMQYNSKI